MRRQSRFQYGLTVFATAMSLMGLAGLLVCIVFFAVHGADQNFLYVLCTVIPLPIGIFAGNLAINASLEDR